MKEKKHLQPLTPDEVVYDLSPEAVTRLAMAEELRLLSAKFDRLYSEIEANSIKNFQLEMYINVLQKGISAIKQLKKHERVKQKRKRERASGALPRACPRRYPLSWRKMVAKGRDWFKWITS